MLKAVPIWDNSTENAPAWDQPAVFVKFMMFGYTNNPMYKTWACRLSGAQLPLNSSHTILMMDAEALLSFSVATLQTKSMCVCLHFLFGPYLAPGGGHPLHTWLPVTGLGVHWPFSHLGTWIVRHGSRAACSCQSLAHHPTGLDPSATTLSTEGPRCHHPPDEAVQRGLGSRNTVESHEWQKK